MNIEMLRATMQEKGISVTEMAKTLGIDASTLYRKIDNGGKKLTVEQVRKMAVALNLTIEQANCIFFS